jgi:drug/metabolite transporter (DMT)-like permease
MTTARQKKLALLAWIAVCLIWGTTYLGIRISLESMPPALMGGLRWTIAGVLLALFVRARGEALPPPSRWGGITLMGFLLLGLGNGGVVFAEQWVPSGLAAVMVATSPFWMAAVEASLRDGERLRASTLAGLLVGFAGILVLVWPEVTLERGDRRFLAGIVALQIASFGWALGSAYSRRHARTDNILGTTALQMLAGGLMMTAAGTLRGEFGQLYFTTRTATALVYLSTIGAIGGFVAYTYALRHLRVSFVSLYAYINPVIAVALGVALMGEPFDRRMATAAALVFAGVAIVRWKGGQGASARGPSANVMVPSQTTRPSTRAMPRSIPMRLRKRRTSASITT